MIKKIISNLVIIALMWQNVAVIASQSIYDIEDYIILDDGTIIERVDCCPPVKIASVVENAIRWQVDTNLLKVSIQSAFGQCSHSVEICNVSIEPSGYGNRYHLGYDVTVTCTNSASGTVITVTPQHIWVWENNGGIYLDRDYEQPDEIIKWIVTKAKEFGNWCKKSFQLGPNEAQQCNFKCGKLKAVCNGDCYF